MEKKTFFEEIKFLLKKSWLIWLLVGIGVPVLIILTGAFINWDGSSLMFWVAFLGGGFIPLTRLVGTIRAEKFSPFSILINILAGGFLAFVIVLLVFLGIFMLSLASGQTYY